MKFLVLRYLSNNHRVKIKGIIETWALSNKDDINIPRGLRANSSDTRKLVRREKSWLQDRKKTTVVKL